MKKAEQNQEKHKTTVPRPVLIFDPIRILLFEKIIPDLLGTV